jgi:hypothetical protein
LSEKTKHKSDKKLKFFLAPVWLNLSLFQKTKPRTRMAAVFSPDQAETVRVLQYETVTHQEYGKEPQACTEDFGMEAARTAPFLLSRSCYARPLACCKCFRTERWAP